MQEMYWEKGPRKIKGRKKEGKAFAPHCSADNYEKGEVKEDWQEESSSEAQF